MPVYSCTSIEYDGELTCHIHSDCSEHPEIGAECHAVTFGSRAGVTRYKPMNTAETETWVSSRCIRDKWHRDWASYAGRVVAVRYDHNYRLMSDVYGSAAFATVYTGGTFSEVYAWCEMSDCLQPKVDAPAELITMFSEHLEQRKIEAAERERLESERRAAEMARQPAKGRRIRVVRGRKVPKGTEGVCVWIGDGTYGRRVGIKDDAGNVHWTAASNVEATV